MRFIRHLLRKHQVVFAAQSAVYQAVIAHYDLRASATTWPKRGGFFHTVLNSSIPPP